MRKGDLSMMILLALTGCGQPPEAATTEEKTALQTEAADEPVNEAPAPTIKIASVDPTVDGIKILLRGEELPACDQATAGTALYIEETEEFVACASGEWVAIDLRGAAGAKGEKGDPGAPGRDGEAGAKGDQGETGAPGQDGQDGAQGLPGTDGTDGAPGAPGAPGVDGQDGAPGVDGVDGADGAPGQDGADGQDGAGAVRVYLAADDSELGISLGQNRVVFSGGGLADFNLGDGTFLSSLGYRNGAAISASCGFITTDCSGTCYAMNFSNELDGTMKGTVFKTGSGFVKATGEEVDTGPVTIRSFWTGNACNNVFGSKAQTASWPVTDAWTPPAAYPFGALYFGG